MTPPQPPTLRVIRRATGPGREHLVVDCPYCPHEHLHGVVGPNLGDGNGHRVAGCRDPWRSDNPGYILREVPAQGSTTAEDVTR